MYNMLFNRIDLLCFFTFLTLFSSSLSYLLKPIWYIIGKPQAEERAIRDEIKGLKLSQQKLSIKDNFVAHSKMQRRINKLEDVLKGFVQIRVETNTKIKYLTTWSAHLSLSIFIIAATIFFRKIPLIVFNQNLFPFENFFGYSSGVPHSIVPHSWIIISRVSTATILKAISQFT